MKPSSLLPSRLLVVGLGNLLLKDDGVGVHAARVLRERLPRRVLVAEVGTAVLTAMHLIEKASLILAIDAMMAGGKPGDIYLRRANSVASPGQTASVHEWTFLSALEMAPRHHPEVWVLGVEPGEIGYGLELTPAVSAALPRVAEVVEQFLADRIVAWIQGRLPRQLASSSVQCIQA